MNEENLPTFKANILQTNHITSGSSPINTNHHDAIKRDKDKHIRHKHPRTYNEWYTQTLMISRSKLWNYMHSVMYQ